MKGAAERTPARSRTAGSTCKFHGTYRSEGEECVARPTEPSVVLMKRQAPEQSPLLDEPNVSHLHRSCLLWTYYLLAKSEAKKRAFLYEAAGHLMLLQPCGNEGEEVYVQVWEANTTSRTRKGQHQNGCRL